MHARQSWCGDACFLCLCVPVFWGCSVIHAVQSPLFWAPSPYGGLAWWELDEVNQKFPHPSVYVCTLKSVIAFQLMDKWEFHPRRAIVQGHLWLVSLYIGLQAVFIIFHYSCFVHDCTRRALIIFVGVELVEMFPKLTVSGSLPQMSWPFSRQNLFQKEPKRSYRSGTKTWNLQLASISVFAETCCASRDWTESMSEMFASFV